MQKKQGEKQLIIVFIRMNKIVEYQGKKYDNYSGKRGCKGAGKFYKPRAAKNILVKTGNVINGNPKNRYKNEAKVKTVVKFNGNIYSETLWFNNGFSVYEEHNPANCGS
jgi:hypothetical protein